jgi:hypothetical protein
MSWDHEPKQNRLENRRSEEVTVHANALFVHRRTRRCFRIAHLALDVIDFAIAFHPEMPGGGITRIVQAQLSRMASATRTPLPLSGRPIRGSPKLERADDEQEIGPYRSQQRQKRRWEKNPSINSVSSC